MVVTDGFTGNVALKTGRGRAEADRRAAAPGVHAAAWRAKLAYLLARPALDRLREWLDPRRYNGAVMLGLNGVVVKSHGGTDAQGFAHAVDVAMDMVVHASTTASARGSREIVGLTAGAQTAREDGGDGPRLATAR